MQLLHDVLSTLKRSSGEAKSLLDYHDYESAFSSQRKILGKRGQRYVPKVLLLIRFDGILKTVASSSLFNLTISFSIGAGILKQKLILKPTQLGPLSPEKSWGGFCCRSSVIAPSWGVKQHYISTLNLPIYQIHFIHMLTCAFLIFVARSLRTLLLPSHVEMTLASCAYAASQGPFILTPLNLRSALSFL